jgi:hypothetical protein
MGLVRDTMVVGAATFIVGSVLMEISVKEKAGEPVGWWPYVGTFVAGALGYYLVRATNVVKASESFGAEPYYAYFEAKKENILSELEWLDEKWREDAKEEGTGSIRTQDARDVRKVITQVKKGNWDEAIELCRSMDTEAREYMPDEFWDYEDYDWDWNAESFEAISDDYRISAKRMNPLSRHYIPPSVNESEKEGGRNTHRKI